MDKLIDAISSKYFSQLSIQVDSEPNNNQYTKFDDSLLIVRNPKKSVIVENFSVRQAKLPCKPIIVNQKHFFADNLSILFDFNNNQTQEPILTHPRIAFRRISAPTILNMPIFEEADFANIPQVENCSPEKGFSPKRRHSEPIIRGKNREGKLKFPNSLLLF